MQLRDTKTAEHTEAEKIAWARKVRNKMQKFSAIMFLVPNCRLAVKFTLKRLVSIPFLIKFQLEFEWPMVWWNSEMNFWYAEMMTTVNVQKGRSPKRRVNIQIWKRACPERVSEHARDSQRGYCKQVNPLIIRIRTTQHWEVNYVLKFSHEFITTKNYTLSNINKTNIILSSFSRRTQPC